MALAFLVLEEAAKSASEDLKATMKKIKASKDEKAMTIRRKPPTLIVK